jgi:hypothetical protein
LMSLDLEIDFVSGLALFDLWIFLYLLEVFRGLKLEFIRFLCSIIDKFYRKKTRILPKKSSSNLKGSPYSIILIYIDKPKLILKFNELHLNEQNIYIENMRRIIFNIHKTRDFPQA